LFFSLPEISFLLLAPFAIARIIFSNEKIWINELDIIPLLWFFSNIFSIIYLEFDKTVINEIIKVTYFLFLYFLFKYSLGFQSIEKIIKLLILTSFLAAFTSIIGFIIAKLGIETTLVIQRPFPYAFNHIIQSKGFTSSPNMLASVIMIGIFFYVHQLFYKKTFKVINALILLILLLGILFTFSKTILCLFIGLVCIWFLHNEKLLFKNFKVIKNITLYMLCIIYFIGTHFIIIDNKHSSEIFERDYISGPIILKINKYSIFPSQYYSLKEISLKAINDSFPLGLGPGKFNDFAHELKKNDSYPTHVPYPEPHSTYLGIIAENGLIGLILIIIIIYLIMKIPGKYFRIQFSKKPVAACLPFIFFVLSIEAFNTDIMNFRHYWILLILLVITAQSASSKRLNL